MKFAKAGSLTIRRYERGDHDVVLELHEAGLREMGTLIEDPEFYRDLLDIEGVYLEGDGEFLVGVCDGQVVAMGALMKTSPGRAEVKRMRVAPTFRRRGFGQAILMYSTAARPDWTIRHCIWIPA